MEAQQPPPPEDAPQTPEQLNAALWAEMNLILNVNNTPELDAKQLEISAIPATPKPEDDPAGPLVGEFMDLAQAAGDSSRESRIVIAFQTFRMFLSTGRTSMLEESLRDVYQVLANEQREDLVAVLRRMRFPGLPPYHRNSIDQQE